MTEKPDWMTDDEWQDTLNVQVFVARWIEHFYGPRCDNFSFECECCAKWWVYVALFSAINTTRSS